MNKDKIDELINKIVKSEVFTDEYSFHTLTFNTKVFDTIDKIKVQFKNYLNWLKAIIESGKQLNYFCSYEVGSTDNIHIHSIFNLKIDDKNNDYLIKKWNKVNNWAFFNDKGIVIKNYSFNENYSYNFHLDTLKEIIDYILKSLYIEYTFLKIYYIMYPSNVFNGSSHNIKIEDPKKFNELTKLAQEASELGLALLLDKYKVLYPFYVDEKDTLSIIYNQWKEKWEANNPFITKLKNIINNNSNLPLDKLELEIENFTYDIKFKIDTIEIQNSKKKEFHDDYFLFLNKFNEVLVENSEFTLLSDYLLKKENIYYYVLDTIHRTIILSKEKLGIKVGKEDLDYAELDLHLALRELKITESLFKGILKNILKENIFEYQLIELYKNKDNSFLFYLKNHENNIVLDIYKFILEDYDSNFKIIEKSLEIYKNNKREWEILLESYIFYIMEGLYMSELLIAEKTIFDTTDFKKQIYITYKSDILNKLIWGYRPLNYDLPLVIKPKEYKYDQTKVKPIGGYYKSLNILFYENKNIKYNLTSKRLKLLNELQNVSFSINQKYLRYLLRLPLNKFKELTNYNLEWFKKEIITNDIKKIRSISELFEILEMFEGIYIAELYTKFDELWAPVQIDMRGRKYYKGYPLNFLGNKVLRELFLLNKYKNKVILKRNIEEALHDFHIYQMYLAQIKSKKEEYNKFNILSNPKLTLVGFDAKSQVFQILGLLVLDINLLHYTNILKIKEELNIGLYEYVLLKYKEKCILKSSDFNIKLRELVTLYCSNFNKKKGLNHGILEYEEILNNIIEKIDRKYVKNILMTWGYNKSCMELIKTTYEFILIGLPSRNKIHSKYLYEISTLITNTIINIFNDKFPMLVQLKKIFQSLNIIGDLLEEGVYINVYKNIDKYESSFIQSYFKEDYVYVSKRVFVKDEKNPEGTKFKKWIHVTYLYENPLVKKVKLDKIKGKLALLPNTAHSIDSELMYYVHDYLLKKNVPVYTIHDGFYSLIAYGPLVKEGYKEGLISIFEDDILYTIIQNSFGKFKVNDNFNKVLNLLEFKFINYDIEYIYDKKYIKKNKLNTLEKTILLNLLELIESYKLIKNSRKLNYKELSIKIKESETHMLE